MIYILNSVCFYIVCQFEVSPDMVMGLLCFDEIKKLREKANLCYCY